MKKKILLITPAPPQSQQGNRISALRWLRLFRKMNFEVEVANTYEGENANLMIALHARKSAVAAHQWHKDKSGPLVVVLGGTDLYRDLGESKEAYRSLEIADRLVVLHPRGIKDLPPEVRMKTTAIIQSVQLPPGLAHHPPTNHFAA